MQCPNCGTEVAQSRYCPSCGAAVTGSFADQEKPNGIGGGKVPTVTTPRTQSLGGGASPTPQVDSSAVIQPLHQGHQTISSTQPISFWAKLLVALIMVCLLGVGSVSFYNTAFASPQKQAQRFSEAASESDWSAMWKLLDIPQSDLVNEAFFIRAMKTRDKFNVPDFSKLDTSPNTEYEGESQATYPLAGNDPLMLTKKPNRFAVIENWQIEDPGFVSKKASFEGPAGLKIKVADKAATEESEGIYSVGPIVVGSYKISIEDENFEAKPGTLRVYYGGDTQSNIPPLTLKKEKAEQLLSQATTEVAMITTSIFTLQSYGTVADLLGYVDGAEDRYSSVTEAIRSRQDSDPKYKATMKSVELRKGDSVRLDAESIIGSSMKNMVVVPLRISYKVISNNSYADFWHIALQEPDQVGSDTCVTDEVMDVDIYYYPAEKEWRIGSFDLSCYQSLGY